MTPSPTLQDIATAAGVSTATVSRVLNRPDAVRPVLRARVEAQIDLLGYVRHGAARALASSRTMTVGAIIPTLESAIFASGINAVENRLDQDGYTLLLAVTNYDRAHEYRQVRTLIERGVDGMILVGQDHAPETFELLARQRCPFILTWTYASGSRYPCVGFDNVAAARGIADHLLDLGHLRLGIIAGITAGNDRARERVSGIGKALDARGLAVAPAHLIEQPYDVGAGRAGFRALMAQPADERPTAICCGNDVLAVGAVLEAQAMGLRVPDDVSIAGFDDLPMAEHLPPGLTTVRVPSRRMGRYAADYILGQATGAPFAARVELQTELIIRGTTAAPPAD